MAAAVLMPLCVCVWWVGMCLRPDVDTLRLVAEDSAGSEPEVQELRAVHNAGEVL